MHIAISKNTGGGGGGGRKGAPPPPAPNPRTAPPPTQAAPPSHECRPRCLFHRLPTRSTRFSGLYICGSKFGRKTRVVEGGDRWRGRVVSHGDFSIRFGEVEYSENTLGCARNYRIIDTDVSGGADISPGRWGRGGWRRAIKGGHFADRQRSRM